MTEKTIVQKLQIKSNSTIAFIKAPVNYQQNIGELPEGCTVLPSSSTEKADFIQVFVANKSELVEAITALKGRVNPNGALWISYYKGTSKISTDINRDSIWQIGREYGIDAVRQIAIDQDWSSLRFKIIA